MDVTFSASEWGLHDGKGLGGVDGNSRYMYFRIRKAADGVILAACLNVNLLKETKTPEELAKKISDNVKNPESCDLWPPLALRRVPQEKKDQVRKIVDLWDQEKK